MNYRFLGYGGHYNTCGCWECLDLFASRAAKLEAEMPSIWSMEEDGERLVRQEEAHRQDPPRQVGAGMTWGAVAVGWMENPWNPLARLFLHREKWGK